MSGTKGEQIVALLQAGRSYTEIVEQVGCARATISYHAGKLGQRKTLRKYDWKAIQAFHDAGNSYLRCRERFGFSGNAWEKAQMRGELVASDFRISLSDLLTDTRKITARGHLKRRLLGAGVLEERCAWCGITEWRGQPLSLDLHHINGDKTDNRLENLVLLCPNCHSQTPNYCGRNIRRDDNGAAIAATQSARA